ncbi:S41 family peptidase [Candidatus Saccharibacteria bacterium]|nr:S41 family peptidase [Candidatus Saccharibacteria bacterium]
MSVKSKSLPKERKTSLGNAIIIGAVLAVVGFIAGLNAPAMINWLAPYFGGKSYVKSDIDWSVLDTVYEKLINYYDGEISKTDVIEGAKKGLTEALGDPYTSYMDAETAKDFLAELHGEIDSAGIGVEMGLRDGYVRVLRTLPDNPARAAGILAGDILYKVDGEEIWDLSVDEVAQKVRGERGSEVTITVVRDGEELSFTMKRDTINNVSAYTEYDGQTAIITITRFDNDTGRIVKNEVNENFDSHNVNKVILDLRGNGGGYVSAAQELLSLWVDGDTILIQKSKHERDSSLSTTSGRARLAGIKTIVLVDGSTASASEIVAGALQDYEKATILGEKTYGKGVVQNMFELSGSTILKVTTASWYTPLGRSINKTGIEPDVEVKRSYDDINNMVDPQMDAAKNM